MDKKAKNGAHNSYMNERLYVRLQTTPEQDVRLHALQRVFAQACNALAEIAREARVWSRVGLHQLGYYPMRERFPALGSQMVCNAVYSVCRACRLVYQDPQSPYAVGRAVGARLPVIRFTDDAPVYFDRHTLSLRAGHASMFTLDGRLRFNLPLAPVDEQRFRHARLIELKLTRDELGVVLVFTFADESGPPAVAMVRKVRTAPDDQDGAACSESHRLPPYLCVATTAEAAVVHLEHVPTRQGDAPVCGAGGLAADCPPACGP